MAAATVELGAADGSTTGLNPNWVEELLRRENRNVEDVWLSQFNRDFKRYLSHVDPQTTNTLSAFELYLVDSYAVTDLRLMLLNLRDFRDYVERERTNRWITTMTKTAANGARTCPPLPPPTPFNSSAHFLEFYFMRLIPLLKGDVLDHIKTFLESDRSAAHVTDVDKRAAMLGLSPLEGEATSFDLVPINPHEKRGVPTLRSEDCGQLVVLSGVVTRCSDVKPELRFGTFSCEACQSVRDSVEQQFKYTEPTFCGHAGCFNRTKWDLKLESCIFGDWQKLRIQQVTADDVPAGTVPRTLDVVARGAAVERCKPGDKILATGCLLAVPDVPSMLRPGEVSRSVQQDRNRAMQAETGMAESGIKGLAKLGVRELAYKQVFLAVQIQPQAVEKGVLGGDAIDQGTLYSTATAAGRLLKRAISLASDSTELPELLHHPLLRGLGITLEQHTRFKQISSALNCLDRIVAMVAPEIFGAVDVKKGIMLMLVGGVEKRTRKDNIKLRGDINVCLVGDPGVAKSQLLKWVQGFADRAVFTSGKSSTAAGLTASVHKDPEQGEAVVEAGALILADNGVCCIDEFDKMDEKDMVAIHEAMEQQTISISKAGVQATMNARASVLAACNPVEGRYDVTRRLRDNLRLSPTILSRFDLIFVLLDRASEEEDRRIAEHVLHLCATGRAAAPINNQQNLRGALLNDQAELKTYMKIAKVFRPRITQQAKSVLVRQYVTHRQRDAMAGEKRSQRVTVRQLESLVRLSEAVAKLQFSDIVTKEHAETAVQTFSNCLTRVKSDPVELYADDEDDEMAEEAGGDTGGPQAKPPMVMDSDLYELIQSQVLTHLRELEEHLFLAPDAATKQQIISTKTKDSVVAWYLSDFHSDLTDGEDIRMETDRINRILNRMIKSGMVLKEAPDMESTLEVLRVHPNLEGGPAVGAGRKKKTHQTMPTEFYAQEVAAGSTGGATAALPSSSEGGGSTVEGTMVARGPVDSTASLQMTDGDFLSMVYNR